MIFITQDDLKVFATDQQITQITQQDATILDVAEGMAIQSVRDALYTRYDVNSIFTTGTRSPTVVFWVTIKTLYLAHFRIADKHLPPRINDAWNEVNEILQQVSNGTTEIDLPRIEQDIETKRRWGSKPRRN